MRRKSFNGRIWPTIIVILLVAGVCLVGGTLWWTKVYYKQNLKPVGNGQSQQTVTIPNGYTLKQTAALLEDKKLIRNAMVFEQYVRRADASNKIKAGTYQLSSSYSVEEIVSIITEGKIKTNLITIVPGQTLSGVKRALKNAGYSEQEITDALDPGAYNGHAALVDKPAGVSLEGFLYPDSFQKTNETSAQSLVKASLDEMQKHLNPDLRSAISRQGLSVYQGIILASIVENEVPKESDRKQVAQVFLRRLREGKRLESDATRSYSKVVSELTGRPADNSYDTYLHDGLPKTPISNVSISSLQAVADPATTDWLYFVSGDDGNTHFSRTLDEHQALTAQYCKQLCQQ